MKIDPCPCVISLKDSSVHTLFEFRHFLELVEDCMGYDAAKWLRTHVEQAEKAADYTQAKVDTDLTAAEPFRIFKRKPPQLPKFFKESGLIVKKSPIP